jgi:hypothetical protein
MHLAVVIEVEDLPIAGDHDSDSEERWAELEHMESALRFVHADEFSTCAVSQSPTTGDLLAKSVTKGRDMRPVIVQMGVTLDGFVHGVKGYEDWGMPPDDSVVIWKVASLREAGTR